MSKPKHIEPLLWSLFGAGGMTIAFFMTGIILSLVFFDASTLSYERMHAFFMESWIGRLSIIVALVPSYWGCIHRVYHGMHDLQIHAGNGIKVLCYGFAMVLSIATVVVVI
ncbi:fumarate reductase subunit FrdD [Sansalvadorimonas verongulae]|uniref:fumarate reductase subunit FrdD n=1 Tax=Sansalvadorimonas verongulae TaxID=2172824 RepID=UPI0012BC5C75|nr:fumarate reductase subunit FrdD [Sansalvadorimonas verongulae]MTI13277.1 fumarate reductase subunit D [Sansalvadorimonas verongulae]